VRDGLAVFFWENRHELRNRDAPRGGRGLELRREARQKLFHPDRGIHAVVDLHVIRMELIAKTVRLFVINESLQGRGTSIVRVGGIEYVKFPVL
jgi:hypothetical protein